MKDIEKLVIYSTKDGNNKAHIFYSDGTERDASVKDAIDIIHGTVLKYNMSEKELDDYLKSDKCRFVFGKGIDLNKEEEYLNSFRKVNNNSNDIEKINGHNVNVNRVAFPNKGADLLTENDFEDNYDSDFDSNQSEVKKEGKIRKFFKKMADKFKKSRLGVKLTAVAITAAMLLGLYSAANRKTMDGRIANNNIVSSQSDIANDENNQVNDIIEVPANEEKIPETEYQKLLAQATSLRQREVMQMMSDNLDYYNIEFANAHKEAGKDIRTNITWDEMMALQIAVNDYTDEELRELFPQLKVNSNFVNTTMENYYRANKQLMMSYIIETKESRVNAYRLIENAESRELVKKYEDMYFAAHEATGTEKQELVKKFYESVRKYFNLGVQTSYKEYDSSSQLINNMALAGLVEFRNIDNKLTDEEIITLNNIKLCKIANDKIENHLYKIVKSAEKYCYGSKDGTSKDGNDSTIYGQFKDEKVKELTEKGYYFESEEKRDISKYDAFKKRVNGEFDCFNYYEIEHGKVEENDCAEETKKVVKYEKETSSKKEVVHEKNVTNTNSREEAIKKSSKELVEKAEFEVDCKIEEENKARKEEAERKAEENRKKLQKEADEQAKKNKEEVKKDKEDLQKKIDEANKKIDKGEIINEKELEHDVKFDEDHSDGKGNLDDSVKDITTDDTGANEPLPDPNKTGEEFDKKSQSTESNSNKSSNSSNSSSSSSSNSSNSSSNSSSSSSEEITTEKSKDDNKTNESNNSNSSSSNNSNKQESTTTPSSNITNTTSGKQVIIEYEEPIDAPYSDEQLVDAYINSLEGFSTEENNKVLSK